MSDKGVTEIKQAANTPYEPMTHCELDEAGHCITCSDEAIAMKVVSVDELQGLAQVGEEEQSEEVDVSLIEDVVPCDMVLIHGGVAIAHLGRAGDE